MNVLHMKYAVEVARAGSINKAAEELYMAQPNLSRCIKELEADLGIAIFERSPKGMTLTPEGEGFIRVNIACPRSTLEQALRQLEAGVKKRLDSCYRTEWIMEWYRAEE